MQNMSEPLAYLNGRYVPLSQAAVGVFDVGFLQGVAVAEQLRTFRGQLFRLDVHLARLRRSLEIIGVETGLPLAEIGQIATRLIDQNRQLLDEADDQQCTIFVTPGMSPAHTAVAGQVGPTVCVHTQPIPFGPWPEKYGRGESLVITGIRQVPETCWPAELKCRSRMHYYLADQQARSVDPVARALLLDAWGNVTEASTANVVFYSAREGLVSPPKERILPGVSVAVVEQLAAELKIMFSHRDLSARDIASADEVLLCSTSPCVWSATRLNHRPIGTGLPGPIAHRLRKAWSALVGIDIEQQAAQFAARNS
jgi:branched-chain amino acid aminotransferase